MKKFPIWLALPCILLAGCGDMGLRNILVNTVESSSGGGNSTVTTAQASKAGQAVIDGVTLVMDNQLSWTTIGTAVSYSISGLSMTGTLTTVFPINTYTLTITFSGYVDGATGYTLNGTVNLSEIINTSTLAMSGTATGNLTSSGGPVTTQTWNVSFSGTTTNYTFTGTITCNGTAFNASTLSL